MPIGNFYVRDITRDEVLFEGTFESCAEAQACYYSETPEMQTSVEPAPSDYDN